MVKRILIKNKRGWIKILEVFIAIMLISGIMVVIVNQANKGKEFERSKVLDIEERILRELQLNDSVRSSILELDEESLPKDNLNGDNFPETISNEMEKVKPYYLECYVNICDITSSCNIEINKDKEIFADSIGFFANEDIYNPRKLKLFCWKK